MRVFSLKSLRQHCVHKWKDSVRTAIKMEIGEFHGETLECCTLKSAFYALWKQNHSLQLINSKLNFYEARPTLFLTGVLSHKLWCWLATIMKMNWINIFCFDLVFFPCSHLWWIKWTRMESVFHWIFHSQFIDSVFSESIF